MTAIVVVGNCVPSCIAFHAGKLAQRLEPSLLNVFRVKEESILESFLGAICVIALPIIILFIGAAFS